MPTDPNRHISPSEADVEQRTEIDHSVRLPVGFFLLSATTWLVVAMFLGFLASMKLHWPEMLSFDFLYFLNYPRLDSAFINVLLYGWALQAGLGVAIWLMARLCRTPVRKPATLLVAGHIWNVGVIVGVFGILAGFGNLSLEWMEMPTFAWPLLFSAYAIISVVLFTMFARRSEKSVFVSQWYILGAGLWFPWIFLTSRIFVYHLPISPLMKAAIAAWSSNALLFLVLVPLGLAAAYYLIPKVLGRPIHSYQLAIFGFWGLAIFGPWMGVHKLLGGPLPAWMSGVGGAATILFLIPAIAVGINLHYTTKGNHRTINFSPTMRFTVFGAMCFTGFAVMAAIYCFFPIAGSTQFTLASVGFQMMGIYAFFSMVMFGAIYFIIPRITRSEWRSAKLIHQHFWFSTYGTIFLVGGMVLGGFSQSIGAADLDQTNYRSALEFGLPLARALALFYAFFLLANGVFLYHLARMLLGHGLREGTAGPTLLDTPHPGLEQESILVEGFSDVMAPVK